MRHFVRTLTLIPTKHIGNISKKKMQAYILQIFALPMKMKREGEVDVIKKIIEFVPLTFIIIYNTTNTTHSQMGRQINYTRRGERCANKGRKGISLHSFSA